MHYKFMHNLNVIHKPANSSSNMDICSILCCTELYFFWKVEQFLGISNSMMSEALDLHKVASLSTAVGMLLDNSHCKTDMLASSKYAQSY